MAKSLVGTKSHENLKHAFAGGVSGQQALSLFRKGGRYRRLPGRRRFVPGYL
jgi:hypothetical protein